MHSHDIGLVLAGGGGKGAYQIGALQALEAAGLKDRITGISGSSVGALNTALFVYLGAKKAAQVWSDVKQGDFSYIKAENFVVSSRSPTLKLVGSIASSYIPGADVLTSALDHMVLRPFSNYMKETGGLFSQSRLKQLLEGAIDFSADERYDYSIFSTVSRKKTSEYIEWNNMSVAEIPDLILASSALPAFYAAKKLGGRSYQDGGITDNVPVTPLYEDGCRRFIVVYLQNRNNEQLKNQVVQEDESFPCAQFLRIIPRDDMKDGLWQTITVHTEKTQRLIQFGFEDAQEALERCGWL